MSRTNSQISASRVGLLAIVQTLLMAVLIEAPSCTKAPITQSTFASPEDAGAALLAAARSGDRNALTAIFGPGSRMLLVTDDPKTDGARLRDFVSAYGDMHRWRPLKAGGQVLQVGLDNYPFPIPLGRNSSGRWYFDTAAGKDEMLARRVGRNELAAMDTSKAIADAERQYWRESHAAGEAKEYAQKFVSSPGTQNGLYWPAAGAQPPSPLGRMADFTAALGSPAGATGAPQFNGYCYRILTRGDTPAGIRDYVVDGKMTGGFAILAYPSEYQDSGIMSFLIGEDGRLYQKDLGGKTAELAAGMTEANPKDGWTSIQTQTNTAARAQE